jgi:transcriptional regulator with XRE-family HTH domain
VANDEVARAVLTRFGRTVRNRRLELGISQEALAELAGLHRTYVGSLERGERNVSLINITRLAAALNIAPDDLLST